MDTFLVSCIKRDGADADRRLDGIGGVANGRGWFLDIDSAIEWIEQQKAGFYTNVRGRSEWVVVRVHATSGRKYLTTEGDGFPPNNLLALPECP